MELNKFLIPISLQQEGDERSKRIKTFARHVQGSLKRSTRKGSIDGNGEKITVRNRRFTDSAEEDAGKMNGIDRRFNYSCHHRFRKANVRNERNLLMKMRLEKSSSLKNKNMNYKNKLRTRNQLLMDHGQVTILVHLWVLM